MLRNSSATNWSMSRPATMLLTRRANSTMSCTICRWLGGIDVLGAAQDAIPNVLVEQARFHEVHLAPTK